MSNKKRVLIVGGVAGGASCAARLRRIDEHAEIVIFERGEQVSFANCGLPYTIGGVIDREDRLVQISEQGFFEQFAIEVRIGHRVEAIDRRAKTLTVRRLADDQVFTERYDALVLAPGAAPIRPPLPGIDRPGVFTVRALADSARVREHIAQGTARRAVVIGAGFIGLEMAENLLARGLSVTILELTDQVLPPLDREMALLVADRLRERGVDVILGDGVAGFFDIAEHPEAGSVERGSPRTGVAARGPFVVQSASGRRLVADLAILGLGVRPESDLAKAAGLDCAERGAIRVDASMQTSDPHIWAVGDCVEVLDYVTGHSVTMPLAGPAHRQGRVAADAISGRDRFFRGAQGTAVCGVFGLTIAVTGASEKALQRYGLDYEKVYLSPHDHAAYYPGARRMTLKLLFDPADGRVLGAQAVGEAGVERRIDVVATMIHHRATVFDLEEAELCYAPQYGAAKDAVNLAGMAAANVVRGDVRLAHWDAAGGAQALILDVRSARDYQAGHFDRARHLPLSQLRDSLGELPRDREIWVYCNFGQSAYYACRVLSQHGFSARNLSGGYHLAKLFARL